MRALTVSLTALLLTCGALAQQKYVVIVRAKEVGTASLTQRIQADGSKVVELLMTMKQGKQKVYVRTRSEYAKDGLPRRMFQAMTTTEPVKRRQTNVEFQDNGAMAARDAGSGWTRQLIELPKSEPKAALSEFWFLRDVPKKGDACKAFIFDLDQLRWDLRTTTYEGETDLILKGKKVRAHRVVTEHNLKSVTAYMDSKGWPIRIESGDTVIERQSQSGG